MVCRCSQTRLIAPLRCATNPKQQVDLPIDKGVVLLDIGFTGTDRNHGARLFRRARAVAVGGGGRRVELAQRAAAASS